MPAHADPPGAAVPASLAARQLALVAALVAGGEPPEGLDACRVRVQATALLAKRARSVARHQPELAAELADDFLPAFKRYAADGPATPPGSSADAREFARYIRGARRRALFRRR